MAQFISYLAFTLMGWVSWPLYIFVFLALFLAPWWPNIWLKMGFPELFQSRGWGGGGYIVPIYGHSLLGLQSWCHIRKSSQCNSFNSLRPSDAIWRQWSWTTLAQVMACCLTAPSHYLNQCWLIIRGVLWHTSESSFAGIAQGIDSGYEFEKDILKNIFKSPRGQWVNNHVHIDFISGCPILKWLAEISPFDKVPR